MKALDAIKDRLLDIELLSAPPKPIDYTLNSIIILSIVVIIILTIIFVRRRFKYKRLLSRLKVNLISSVISPKEASYTLAKIIRSANNTKHLTTSLHERPEWNDFLSQLSEYRYQFHDTDKKQLLNLIDNANNWLKASKP